MDMRRSVISGACLLLAACSPPLEGQLIEGVLIAQEHQFVATDGTVFSINVFDADHAELAGLRGPLCLTLDASLGEEADPQRIVHSNRRLIVHSVRDERVVAACRFQHLETYRGLLGTPTEGVYYYVGGDADPLAPVNVDEGLYSRFIEHRTTPELRNNLYRACLEVEGALSQYGQFNHLGGSTRQLTILRVVRVWRVPDVPYAVTNPAAPPPLAPAELIAACVRG